MPFLEREIYQNLRASKEGLAQQFSEAFKHTVKRIVEFPKAEEVLLVEKVLTALRNTNKRDDDDFGQQAIITLGTQFQVANDESTTVLWSGPHLPIHTKRVNRYLTADGRLVSRETSNAYRTESNGNEQLEVIKVLGADEIIANGLSFLYPSEESFTRDMHKIDYAREILPELAQSLGISSNVVR